LAWGNELNGMDDISAVEHSTEQLLIDRKNDIFKDHQSLQDFY
jgi:hypothetical protein